MTRAFMAMNLFERAKSDYAALPDGSTDADLQAVHRKVAEACLEFAKSKGGVYVKAAQLIASLCVRDVDSRTLSAARQVAASKRSCKTTGLANRKADAPLLRSGKAARARWASLASTSRPYLS